MPIDPGTGLDPESGMLGLKETHQPTGAIGAVMSYLNADKSRQISDALQQHRAAQAQMAQQQADEYASRQARDDQIRQAMATLSPTASPDEMINTYVRSGGDPEKGFPFFRAKAAAGGKADVARVNAGKDAFKALVGGGIPAAQALSVMSRTYDADELAQITRELGASGQQPMAVPAAKAARDTAEAGLAGEKTTDLAATRPSRIALNKAKAETDRLMAQAATERAKRGGTRQRSTTLAIEGQIARLGKYINDTMEKVDPLTFHRGPKDMTEVNEWKAQKARLEAELAAGDESDDDVDASPQAALAKPGAPKGSPDPFGSIGFLKKTTTPAGGSTTAPGGTLSPNPADRLDLLK